METTRRDYSDFWVKNLRDLERTFRSVREHGGFAVMCSDWRISGTVECARQLDELIDVLGEWRCFLDGDVAASKRSRTAANSRRRGSKPTFLRQTS
jgi:hypothetical protein